MLKTTGYFDNLALQKHPEIQREWIQYVLTNPVKTEKQANNRLSYWETLQKRRTVRYSLPVSPLAVGAPN